MMEAGFCTLCWEVHSGDCDPKPELKSQGKDDTMRAGRELDKLVAEKVMGIRAATATPLFVVNGNQSELPPHYSTDIAAAWTILERLFELGFDFEVENYSNPHLEYRIAIRRIGKQEEAHLVFGKEIALIICEAALKAVEKP